MNSGLIPIEGGKAYPGLKNFSHLTELLGQGLRLRAFACKIKASTCLAVLAPADLFKNRMKLGGIYQRLNQYYPDCRILILQEEQGQAGHYFGHPDAEWELFEIKRQVKEQLAQPPAYCMLPAREA